MRAFESDAHPLYVCTGPIRSGKTTALMNGPAKIHGVAGVLTPDVNGIRKLYDLKTRTFFPFQIENEVERGEAVITIGRFAFYESAFARARLILETALQEQPRLLIIDEIGRLELQQQGFEPAAGEIIRAHRAGDLQGDLLIVVRDTLLNQMVSHYHIQRYQILHSGDCHVLRSRSRRRLHANQGGDYQQPEANRRPGADGYRRERDRRGAEGVSTSD